MITDDFSNKQQTRVILRSDHRKKIPQNLPIYRNDISILTFSWKCMELRSIWLSRPRSANLQTININPGKKAAFFPFQGFWKNRFAPLIYSINLTINNGHIGEARMCPTPLSGGGLSVAYRGLCGATHKCAGTHLKCIELSRAGGFSGFLHFSSHRAFVPGRVWSD